MPEYQYSLTPEQLAAAEEEGRRRAMEEIAAMEAASPTIEQQKILGQADAWEEELKRKFAKREAELEAWNKKAREESLQRFLRSNPQPKMPIAPSESDVNYMEGLQNEVLLLEKQIKDLKDQKQQNLQDKAPGQFVPFPSGEANLTQTGRRVGNTAIAAASESDVLTTEQEDRISLESELPRFDLSTARSAPSSPFSDPFVNTVKKWEGWDTGGWDGGQYSTGYGTRARYPGETLSPEEADRRLREELAGSARAVDEATTRFKRLLTPSQRDALISFDYNTGKGASIIERFDKPEDMMSKMSEYIYDEGRIVPGLIERRKNELDMFASNPVSTGTQQQPTPTVGLPVSKDWFATEEEEQRYGGLPSPERRAQIEASQRLQGDTGAVPTSVLVQPTFDLSSARTTPPSQTPYPSAQPTPSGTQPTYPATQQPAQVTIEPSKREVGFLELAKRGTQISSIGLGETVNRYAYAPVVHGLSTLIQEVAPNTDIAKKAQEFDQIFYHNTVEVPAAQRKALEVQPSEAPTFPGELGMVMGQMIPDLATAITTGGLTTNAQVAARTTQVAEKMAPTILNIAKSHIPGMRRAAAAFAIPAAKAGMDAQKASKEAGESPEQQATAYMTAVLQTMGSAALPMQVESGLPTLAGRVISRGAQTVPLAAAQVETSRAIQNVAAAAQGQPQQPFDIKELLKGVIPLTMMGAAGGKRARPKSELKSFGELPPLDFEKPPKPPTTEERFAGLSQEAKERFAGRPTIESEKGQPPLGIVPSPKVFAVPGMARRVSKFVTQVKPVTDFRRALNAQVSRDQVAFDEVRRMAEEIERIVPSPIRRAGITNFIQAGGDLNVLATRARMTKDINLKRGYEAAQTLTTEELGIVRKINGKYAKLRLRAIHYGIELNQIQNYVNQIWNMGEGRFMTPRKLATYLRESKPRTFESFYEGEQAGYKPKTKDISKLLAIYTNNISHAINSKIMVEDMSKGKASDGKPIVAPIGGSVQTIDPTTKAPGARLVFPEMRKEDLKSYVNTNQPALSQWKYIATDIDTGKPILMKADLVVHPEHAVQLERALGTSMLRQWWNQPVENPFLQFTKNSMRLLLDEAQPSAKATMLSFSPFHQVQEGTHAYGHMPEKMPHIIASMVLPQNTKFNPLAFIPKIEPSVNPGQRDATRHGLMLAPDRISQQYFMDGVGSDNRNLVTRGLRKYGGSIGTHAANYVDGYTHWLFEQYIPGLKYVTYQEILERNFQRFKNEIASGKNSVEEIKFLSAEQANAAYGHLNYADIGRSPTTQHIFQIIALAPDFFEARARFMSQALKPSKAGLEQFRAIAVLALTQYISARIANKLNNDDYDWDHPFELRIGNKYYGLRSVPEDMARMVDDPLTFLRNRLSPIVGRGIQEFVFKQNWRGETVDAWEATKDIVFGTLPLPAQAIPAIRELSSTGKGNPISPLEQIWSATGLRIHRYSPIGETYKKAKEWQETNDPTSLMKTVFPVSKYAQLRYALEDSDKSKANQEVIKLRATGMSAIEIDRGFKTSMKMPFTGSLANDQKFYDSLDKRDKTVFNSALERRSLIMERYDTWISKSDQPSLTVEDLQMRMFEAAMKAEENALLEETSGR